jgi:hypothetical protein
MPASLVEHEDRVRAWGNGGADLSQMGGHGRGAGKGHDQAGPQAALGTDRAEEDWPRHSSSPWAPVGACLSWPKSE